MTELLDCFMCGQSKPTLLHKLANGWFGLLCSDCRPESLYTFFSLSTMIAMMGQWTKNGKKSRKHAVFKTTLPKQQYSHPEKDMPTIT